MKLTVESEVRSAFLDLRQSDRVLEAETKNVQTADESLEIAKGNLAAGLGTQLDILQAAADVTRTRSTRLGAIFLHNVALARLARACGVSSASSEFDDKAMSVADPKREERQTQMFEVARPPANLSGIENEARAFLSSALPLFFAANVRALTLDAAMQKTLQNNPAIQQAKIELEKAAGQRLVLRSISYPEANLKVIAGVAGGHRIELSDESKAFGFPAGKFCAGAFQRGDSCFTSPRRSLNFCSRSSSLNIAVVEQLHKTRIAFYTALYNRSLETLRESQQAATRSRHRNAASAL